MPKVDPSQTVLNATSPINKINKIITLRTMPTYNPADYSDMGWYEYNNFQFKYNPSSTVKERIFIQDALVAQVDERMLRGIFEVGVEMSVRDGQRKVIAAGHFLAPSSAATALGGLGHDDIGI